MQFLAGIMGMLILWRFDPCGWLPHKPRRFQTSKLRVLGGSDVKKYDELRGIIFGFKVEKKGKTFYIIVKRFVFRAVDARATR